MGASKVFPIESQSVETTSKLSLSPELPPKRSAARKTTQQSTSTFSFCDLGTNDQAKETTLENNLDIPSSGRKTTRTPRKRSTNPKSRKPVPRYLQRFLLLEIPDHYVASSVATN